MSIVSIVTISYNQGRYLERAIRSVLDQSYPDIEYIVVDAGSTDESRSIIARHRSKIATAILEPDGGPADGLNRGFQCATGEYFAFLNADDTLSPGAVQSAVSYFTHHKSIDVVSGHAKIIDENDRDVRLAYSDHFSTFLNAYGACILIQPSTFFRRTAYERTTGFNTANRSNWDGELFVDMAIHGARFGVVDEFWSCYRVHCESITGTKKAHARLLEYRKRVFGKIMGRDATTADRAIATFLRFVRHVRNPRDTYERIVRGPIYGRRG